MIALTKMHTVWCDVGGHCKECIGAMCGNSHVEPADYGDKQKREAACDSCRYQKKGNCELFNGGGAKHRKEAWCNDYRPKEESK